jgi:hypothetical protein
MRSSRKHGETYYAVEFEVVSEGKYAAAIADFRQGAVQLRVVPATVRPDRERRRRERRRRKQQGQEK